MSMNFILSHKFPMIEFLSRIRCEFGYIARPLRFERNSLLKGKPRVSSIDINLSIDEWIRQKSRPVDYVSQTEKRHYVHSH